MKGTLSLIKNISNFKLILSEIIINESRNLLKVNIKDIADKLNKNKHFLYYTSLANCLDNFSIDCSDLSELIISDFIKTTNAKILNLDSSNTQALVFEKYFANDCPFRVKEKKYEFPDAFALTTLEKFAFANNKEIIVLSSDLEWFEYCKNSKMLYITDFPDISRIQKDQPTVIYKLKDFDEKIKISRNIVNIIKSKFNSDIKDSLYYKIFNEIQSFTSDSSHFESDFSSSMHCEYELLETIINEIRYNGDDLNFINISEEGFDIILNTYVDFSCLANFSFYAYDSIDKEQIFIGDHQEEVNFFDILSIDIKFVLENEKINVSYINVDTNFLKLDFGCIEYY